MMKLDCLRLYIGALCLIASVLQATAGEQTDSVQTKDLNELVVTAKRGWIEDDKIVYIPTKTEQKLSNSPETLIESMHLPMLIVKDGSITTVSGETVSIFINGNPANSTDLATFWPKQAKRVEFMRNPSDAKFQGAQNVVNFIMQEYEVGGVTKVDASGNIPNGTGSGISSKLIYKNLEFGIKESFYQNKYYRQSQEISRTYKDLYYNGVFHSLITNQAKESLKQDFLSNGFTLNGRLKLPKGTLDQVLTWNWRKDVFNTHGQNDWDPMLFDSENKWSKDYKRNNIISYSGWYTHQFNSKWFLSGSWSYAHSHTDSHSDFQTSNLPQVFNDAEESSNAMGLALKPTWYVNKRITMQFLFDNTTTWYNTLYSGSADASLAQVRNTADAKFTLWWQPVKSLTFTAQPGVNILYSKIDQTKITYVSPTCNAYVNWAASSKFSLSGSLYYYRQNPSASDTSPITLRISELLWAQGNTYLKPMESWRIYLSPTYIANEWFSVGGTLFYSRDHNPQGITYESAPEDMEGLIRKRLSFNSSDRYWANANISFSAFKRKLNISFSPAFNYDFARPEGRKHLCYFYYDANIDYTVRNCRFAIEYNSKNKSMDTNGQTITERRKGRLNFRFTWGTGNIYLGLTAFNILQDKECLIRTFSSDAYSERAFEYSTGRQIWLSASYTFGYGKKVDRNINILQGTSIDSSILNTK